VVFDGGGGNHIRSGAAFAHSLMPVVSARTMLALTVAANLAFV
jgi:hypothetical protein